MIAPTVAGTPDIEIRCIAPGSEAEEAFLVEEVVPRLRDGRFSALTYVVRTALRRRLIARRAMEIAGTRSVPPRFFTLRELAERLWLHHRDVRPIASAVALRVLLSASLDESLQAQAAPGRRSPLERARGKAGFLDHIARLFDEIDSLGAAAAAGDALARARHGPDLAAVLRSFRARLEGAGLATEGQVYLRVAGALESDGTQIAADSLLVLEGLYQPSAAERRLQSALARAHARTVVLVDLLGTADGLAPVDAVYAGLLAHFRGARILLAPAEPTRAAAIAARRLFTEPRDPVPEDGSVQVFCAPSAPAEVERIAATIRDLADEDPAIGARLSSVVVAFPDIERYAALVRDVFPRFGIPVDLSHGHDLATTPLCRAALALLEVPAQAFERGQVERAFGSPYVTFRSAAGRRLSPRRLDRAARDAGVIGGPGRGRAHWRERLAERLEALRRERSLRASRCEEAIDPRGRWLDAEIHFLEEQIPVLEEAFDALGRLAAGGTPSDLAGRVLEVLEVFGVARAPPPDLCSEVAARDAEAWTRLGEIVRETGRALALAGHSHLSLPGFLDALHLGLRGATFYVAPPVIAERVRVVRLLDLRGLRPRVLFLGGLSRDAFPAPARVDPFLSDADRRRIGLPCRADRLEEALHLFGLALASPSERTVLSFPASGEPEDAESTLLSELRLHVAGLTAPPEARPPRCERERQALVARGSAAALAARPYPPEADLLAALESEVSRAGPLSRYDGLLSPAAAERLDFGPAHAFSATQLELYAICPFKFFARHVLEILPLSEPDLEIAAEERGDIVHEILARFYRGEREAGRRPGAAWIEGAAARLGEVARAVLEARVLRDDLFARRFAEGLLRGIDGRGRPGVLRKFVEWEASDDGGFTPSLFEARFGRLAGPGDLLAAEPVEIAPGVRLAGSIDRIDLGGSDRLRLFDYKTGAYLPRPADLREGIRLQIPLYLVAAAEILGRDPVAGGIYRVRDGAPVGPDRLLRDRAGNADLPRRLSEALVRTREAAARITASMREGRFHPGHLSPERKGCDFCELRAVCRVDHDRMERLFEERAPGLFAPLALWERS